MASLKAVNKAGNAPRALTHADTRKQMKRNSAGSYTDTHNGITFHVFKNDRTISASGYAQQRGVYTRKANCWSSRIEGRGKTTTGFGTKRQAEANAREFIDRCTDGDLKNAGILN